MSFCSKLSTVTSSVTIDRTYGSIDWIASPGFASRSRHASGVIENMQHLLHEVSRENASTNAARAA